MRSFFARGNNKGRGLPPPRSCAETESRGPRVPRHPSCFSFRLFGLACFAWSIAPALSRLQHRGRRSTPRTPRRSSLADHPTARLAPDPALSACRSSSSFFCFPPCPLPSSEVLRSTHRRPRPWPPAPWQSAVRVAPAPFQPRCESAPLHRHPSAPLCPAACVPFSLPCCSSALLARLSPASLSPSTRPSRPLFRGCLPASPGNASPYLQSGSRRRMQLFFPPAPACVRG